MASAAQVTGVSGSIVSLNQIPTGYAGTTKVDLIKNGGLNDIVEFDKVIQSVDVNNSSITLTTAPDVDIEVGDWVSLAGTSPVANIPEDFYPLLEQRTVCKLLEALGDPKAQYSQQKADELEKYLIATIVPRIEEEEPLIVQHTFDGWSTR